jgi:hypothetical protein
MPDWDKKIPKIKGNRAIIEKNENPDHIMFEKKPEKAPKKEQKRTEKSTKVGQKRDERVRFMPNKHVKGILLQVKEKYGVGGLREFINHAIEKEFARRK